MSDPDTPRYRQIHALTRLLLRVSVIGTILAMAAGILLAVQVLSRADRTVCGPLSSGPVTTVVVARLPGGPTEWRSYMKAVEVVSRVTGRPVAVAYAESTSELEQLLRERQDAYFFSTTYAYLYAEAEGLEPRLIAAPVILGRTMESACVVVSESSRFEDLEDLRGRRVGVSDPSSLAGTAYLLRLLDESGYGTLQGFFGSVDAGRSQDSNLRDVLAGELDCTTVNRSQLAAYPEDAFRMIARSPEYGMPPIMCGPEVSREEADEVSRALVDLELGRDTPITGAVEGFSVPTPDLYEYPRGLMRYAVVTG